MIDITAKAATLKDWNLILFGTKTDPLMQTKHKPAASNVNIRKIKQRDHDPAEGGGGLTPDMVDSIARSGIIMPDIEWMMRHNRPTHQYKPPVYEPSNRPDFEYVKSDTGKITHHNTNSAGDESKGRNSFAPLVFNHGDHQHKIGLDGLLGDIIVGSDRDRSMSSSEGGQHDNNMNGTVRKQPPVDACQTPLQCCSTLNNGDCSRCSLL